MKLPWRTSLTPQGRSFLILFTASDILGNSLSFLSLGYDDDSCLVSFCGRFRLSARLTRLVGPSGNDVKSSCCCFLPWANLDCCCLMYNACLPTLAPPPMTRKTSPPGPLVTLSYNSSRSLSNLAGDSFTLSFGEFRNSSKSTSSLLSNSAISLSCRSFGRTFAFVISCDSRDLKLRYLALVLVKVREIFFLCSSLAVRGGRSIWIEKE